jgi:small subunit ribosomal protein S7
MARSGFIAKRKVEEDPIFRSRIVTKLINKVMRDGKKEKARRIVYDAFEQIRQQSQKDPLEVFEAALRNTQPRMEVRPRRVGGATYMVPLEVRGQRKEHLALVWIINAARNRASREYVDSKNKSPIMAKKLAQEILGAAQGSGGAVAKKEEVIRMAEANRAFAHFRW